VGARIRHIAITARDNAKMAQFYKSVFGMTEVFVQPTRGGRAAYYLTDGHINLAILPGGPNSTDGINHFGFQIEDMEETAEAAAQAGAAQAPADVPQDGRFAETFLRDPTGTRVDLSVAGWATSALSEEELRERLARTQVEVPPISTGG
jgi:predicted enzyme related to lactoylglutathione lyase